MEPPGYEDSNEHAWDLEKTCMTCVLLTFEYAWHKMDSPGKAVATVRESQTSEN